MKQFLARLLIALSLLLLSPDMVRAAAGDLFVAAIDDDKLVEITPGGTQTLIAGGLNGPQGVAVDAAGRVYVRLAYDGTIRKITNGVVSQFASGLDFTPDLTFGPLQDLFALTLTTVVKITLNGDKSTYASGFKAASNLAFDQSGNLFVSENGYGNNLSIISKTTPAGVRTTFASGFNNAEGLAFDPAGNLYLAETATDNIYKFTPNGTKTLFTSAVHAPRFLTFDSAGNLFVSNGGSGMNVISKVAPNGTVSTINPGIATSGLAFEPPRGQPLNIATRMNVQTGDNVLIGGFIVTATAQQPKIVVIRGIGPSLTAAGVPNALQDPIIELHYPNGAVVTNDNWQDTQGSAIQGTGLAPKDARESAFYGALDPGNYTVVMKGKNNSTGIGLIEVYDYDKGTISKLANTSTRGLVGTGDNVMIGGFILGTNGARVIVRAIGPSLTQAGIAGALSDPKLSLRNGNGTEIAFNDDWQTTQKAEIQATGVPPSNSLESAIVATLPNGNYTAIVSGYNNATGVGLVEVYNLQ